MYIIPCHTRRKVSRLSFYHLQKKQQGLHIFYGETEKLGSAILFYYQYKDKFLGKVLLAYLK